MNQDGVLSHALLICLLAVGTIATALVLHHFGIGTVPKLPSLPGVAL